MLQQLVEKISLKSTFCGLISTP